MCTTMNYKEMTDAINHPCCYLIEGVVFGGAVQCAECFMKNDAETQEEEYAPIVNGITVDAYEADIYCDECGKIIIPAHNAE